ncbi:MAG: SBBP repeat-containing protein [Candidatus Cloacimonadaceae bacterium]|nr:SBBP repeat-containing protein [Candidatus Cloacimonadaceae bacterium]
MTLLATLSGLAAQTPDWLWARKAGGTNDDEAKSIACDSSGNTYATGSFSGSATFGDSTLISSGFRDIFVSKLDSAGNWLWTTRAGASNSDDYGSGIAVDNAGNVYLTGYFGLHAGSSADFGDGTLICSGSSEIFVAKLDSAGNWLWAKSAGGTGADFGRSIAVDSEANVYLTGRYAGPVSFGSFSLPCNGNSDIFIAKLDNAGNWLWARRTGGVNGVDESWGIALDSAANIYLTGEFYANVSFGNTTLISSGEAEIFVAKLDSGGNWLWAKKAGGVSTDRSYAIAVDSAANIYLTGDFYNNAGSSSTFGTTTLTSSGGRDIFVAKLSSDGNWLWAKSAGGIGVDCGYGIAVDSSSQVYLTGCFGYLAGANASFGSSTLTGSGDYDIFVAKLDSEGNWLWAEKAGGTNADYASGIALDGYSQVYLTGYYGAYVGGSTNFGGTILTSIGQKDIFVAKLSSASAPIPAPLVTIVRTGNNVALSWNAIPGAAGYSVESSNDPYAGFSPVGSTLPGNTTTFSTTASPARKFFRVIALH